MHDESLFLGEITRLHIQRDAEVRADMWRRSMVTLANRALDFQGSPLEGLDASALQASVQVALVSGLVDDLSWLSPPLAAAALYELASALPPGTEKRELGRRVLTRMYEGNASTFATVATSLALGTQRALEDTPVRARVALCLDLPTGWVPQVDRLALTLVAKSDLQRTWLEEPSLGSLPLRRLAARLLERAAREAARRSEDGDDGGTRVLLSTALEPIFQRLLNDREPLVWRHAATARGLLVSAEPRMWHVAEASLRMDASPTEWRRGAASIAAAVAVCPEFAAQRLETLLRSPVLASDRGVAASVVYSLARAADTEPKYAERLLEMVVHAGDIRTIEQLTSMRHEGAAPEFIETATELARLKLRDTLRDKKPSDGDYVLWHAFQREIDTQRSEELGPYGQLFQALKAFAQQNSEQAYRAAQELVAALDETQSRLEQLDLRQLSNDAEVIATLRTLESTLLQRATLPELLLLGARPKRLEQSLAPINVAYARLATWFTQAMDPVGKPDTERPWEPSVAQGMIRFLDSDGYPYADDNDHHYERRRLVASSIVQRLRSGPDRKAHRPYRAALARIFDGLVRDGVCEITDVLWIASSVFGAEVDFTILAEAAMLPELEALFKAYAQVVKLLGQKVANPTDQLDALAQTCRNVARAVPLARSKRAEACRSSLLRLCGSFEALMMARTLDDLGSNSNTAWIRVFEDAFGSLARHVQTTPPLLGTEMPVLTKDVRAFAQDLERLMANASAIDPIQIADSVQRLCGAIRRSLPNAMGEAAARFAERIAELPRESTQNTHGKRTQVRRAQEPLRLPAWLPPHRTIGSYYVLRPLSSGSGGSVFLARRSEERDNDSAPLFAVKVPEYSGASAGALSEQEFQKMFREEAGALLTLPTHPNLARFVTFDAGTRPKPILVMEFVRGPTLDRLIEQRQLTIASCFRILDGVSAGLEAMHDLGVGHLDVKPSNIILRDFNAGENHAEPVLVDFGLAGRRLRPGCATLQYGAPEIWGFSMTGSKPFPAAADIYALGCVIYELLSGTELFRAPTHLATISAHLSHDGLPGPLQAISRNSRLSALTQLLHQMLRKVPEQRTDIRSVRQELKALQRQFEDFEWPIDTSHSSQASG